MRFGVNLLSQHAANRPQYDLYQEMLEQAVAAEELGFDSIFLNEHHPFDRTEELWLQPLPALAGLASRTRRISLGTNILVLPLYHPIRIAEDVGMIHAMSGGRFILGVAIGYKAEEFAAFGLTVRQRVGRFEEQVDVIRRLWREPHVSFKGRHFSFEDVSLPVQTFSQPAPPMWIGAEVEPAIVRAARLGDAWLPADTESIGQLKHDYGVYQRSLREHQRSFDALERPLMRETFVLEDPREAAVTFAPFVLQKYREYWRQGAPQLRAEFASDTFTFDELRRERFIVGSPEDAIAQVRQHERELGITHMIFRVQKKDMPHRHVLRVLRVLGEQVIPHCR
jgi:alkanesulfonate monooxygenase SsuD/methylene tetrahydromethanopterin reductase-like flavin-dependent oxidoreductase (luciferase family)